MRKLSLGFGCVLAMACSGLAAQQLTARQVVDKALAARGGGAAFAAVHSLMFTGEITPPQGPPLHLQVWTASTPARIRIEITTPQGKVVQGYDGQTAWQLMPGQSQAQGLEGTEARHLADEAEGGVDMIADPRAKLQLAGTGKLDGHDYYKVQFTLPSGNVYTQYFDARTWLVFHEEFPGGVEDISGYERTGSLLLPTVYVSGAVGQPPVTLKRTKIALNPAVTASLFVKP